MKRESTRLEAYFLRVNIYNTNKELLETIRSRFGGTVVMAHKETEKWTLTWNHKAAFDIVKIVSPLLIVKSKQAEVASRFQSVVSSINPGRRGILDETLSILRDMKKEMNLLNTKGPDKDKNTRRLTEGGKS